MLAVVTSVFILCINVNVAHANYASYLPEAAELEESLSGHDWSTWEKGCINDALNKTSNKHNVVKLADNIGRNVWKVVNDNYGCKQFSTIEVKNGESYFDYDYKGYFGNCWDCSHCEPNVQFFYNSDSKKLVVLNFGSDTHDYDIINNQDDTYSVDQILKFDDDSLIKISEECKTILVGTCVTTIGRNSFKDFINTELVDIYDKEYDKSNLTNEETGYYILGKMSFAKLGSNTVSGCKMELLNAHNMPSDATDMEHISDLNPNQWAENSVFIFKGKTYRPYHEGPIG